MPQLGEKCKPAHTTAEEVAQCLATDRLVVLMKAPHRGKTCKVIGATAQDRTTVRFKFRVHVGWPLRATGKDRRPEEIELVFNRFDINEELILLPDGADEASQNKLLEARSLYRR